MTSVSVIVINSSTAALEKLIGNMAASAQLQKRVLLEKKSPAEIMALD
jgi:hypothetical protein